MEKRREPRLPANCPVEVTVLATPEEKFQALVVNLSGRGLQIRLDRPLAPGTALKISWRNSLVLGEVVYCRIGGEGIAAGIELEHALYDVSGLLRLAERLKTPQSVAEPSKSREG